MLKLLPTLLGTILAPLTLYGQDTAAQFKLNVNVDLVELQVSVFDEAGRGVTHLTESDFEITEDRVPQTMTLFRHEDLPVSLGLVIDNSRSMERKKDRIDAAALSFVEHSNPDDESFVIHFDDTARLARDFTQDPAALEETLSGIEPYGQTSLYDALALALEHIEGGQYKQKAILLVTDGADNSSRRGYEDVLEMVRLSTAAVYPIGLLSDSAAGMVARHELEKLADVSGGRAFFPDEVEEIPPLTLQIARELRELYVVGYVPTNPRRDGTWRSVRVRVRSLPGEPRWDVNYRHGYYAPLDP